MSILKFMVDFKPSLGMKASYEIHLSNLTLDSFSLEYSFPMNNSGEVLTGLIVVIPRI